jgi:hypothetical protein
MSRSQPEQEEKQEAQAQQVQPDHILPFLLPQEPPFMATRHATVDILREQIKPYPDSIRHQALEAAKYILLHFFALHNHRTCLFGGYAFSAYMKPHVMFHTNDIDVLVQCTKDHTLGMFAKICLEHVRLHLHWWSRGLVHDVNVALLMPTPTRPSFKIAVYDQAICDLVLWDESTDLNMVFEWAEPFWSFKDVECRVYVPVFDWLYKRLTEPKLTGAEGQCAHVMKLCAERRLSVGSAYVAGSARVDRPWCLTELRCLEMPTEID